AATALLRSAGLNWPASLVALAAMVPVTLLDPWALLQPGFWLSFAAVGLLMASAPARAGAGAGMRADADAATSPGAPPSSTGPAPAPRWFERPGGVTEAMRRNGGRVAGELRGGVRAQIVASI